MRRIFAICSLIFILGALLPARPALAGPEGGSTLKFDGSDDYISFGSVPFSAPTSLTIEAWIKPTSAALSGIHDILSIWDSSANNDIIEFRLSGGKLEYGQDAFDWQFVIGGTTLTADVWTHVAVVKNGNSVTLYLNGISDATGNIYNSPGNLNYFDLGVRRTGTGSVDQYFAGQMDEVRIWSTNLSDVTLRDWMYREVSGSSANLVNYYTFNDGSGSTLNDSTASNNDGTLQNFSGTVWVTSGAFSGPRSALDFDGTDDYVVKDAPSSLPLNSAMTLETWVRLDAYTNGAGIVEFLRSSPESACLELELDGSSPAKVIIHTYDGATDLSITSNSTLPLNQWIHIAVVSDGNSGTANDVLYINGIADATGTLGTMCLTDKLNLGINDFGSNEHLNGALDEVRIWNVARTALQIRDFMAQTLMGNESGLVTYYRMDTGAGATLYDLKDTNDGTLTNGPTWVSSAAFNTWIGSEGTGWDTAANWSRSAAPTTSDNVGVIDYTGGNDPTIGATAYAHHLVITSNGALTISGSNTLFMHGNWINNGSFSANASQVMFRDNAYITGAANTAFNDLNLNYSLLGHWRFDDGSGTTAYDSSGYGRSGTLVNGPTWVNSALSTAFDFYDPGGLEFDGADDRVTTAGTAINLANSSFTLSAWARRDSSGSYDIILGQGNQNNNNHLQFGFRDSNYFTCAFWGNDLDTSATYTDNDWHHWACTYDASTNARTIYRDGVSVANGTASADFQGSGTLYIGEGNFTNSAFDGAVDDVRIYDQALTSAQVGALAAGGHPELTGITLRLDQALDVNDDLWLNAGTLDVTTANYDINVFGDFIFSGGKLEARSGTVIFDGSASYQTLDAIGPLFYNLTVVDDAGVSIYGNATIGQFTPDVGNTLTNSGVLRQIRTVDGSSASVTRTFLEIDNGSTTIKYRAAELTTTNNLGLVTASIWHIDGDVPYCTNTGSSSPPYAPRCFQITPANNLGATVRLYALTSEIPLGMTYPSPWRNPGGTQIWTILTGPSRGTVDTNYYTYAQGITASFSYFLIANQNNGPTAVQVTDLSASPAAPQAGPFLLAAAALAAALLIVGTISVSAWVKRRRM